MDILKGNSKVFIDSDKMGLIIKQEQEEVELTFDEKLFEAFKTLRRKIALEHEVPAYVIFGDKTLKELANKLPTNQEEFLEINGVGKVKYEKYGEDFLALCEDLKTEFKEEVENKIPLKKLTKTYLETFDLIQEDKSIEEISQIRDLGISSVLSHLTILKDHDKITTSKKEELLKPLEIPTEINQWVESGLRYENIKQLKQYLYLYEYLKKESK